MGEWVELDFGPGYASLQTLRSDSLKVFAGPEPLSRF